MTGGGEIPQWVGTHYLHEGSLGSIPFMFSLALSETIAEHKTVSYLWALENVAPKQNK